MITILLALLAAITPRCTHDRCTVTISSTVATETFRPSYRLVLSDGRTYRDTVPVFTFSVMGPDSLRATVYATTTAGASRQRTATIFVPAPPPVRQVDTVVVVRVDTVSVLPTGVDVVNTHGEVKVYWNSQHLGRLIFVGNGTVDVIRPAPCTMAMTRQRNHPDQLSAILAMVKLGPVPQPVGGCP